MKFSLLSTSARPQCVMLKLFLIINCEALSSSQLAPNRLPVVALSQPQLSNQEVVARACLKHRPEQSVPFLGACPPDLEEAKFDADEKASHPDVFRHSRPRCQNNTAQNDCVTSTSWPAFIVGQTESGSAAVKAYIGSAGPHRTREQRNFGNIL
ncbi:hypothetical protein B0H14DRAFT_2568040 [Mycena olivaceomarginata]|nr:hypothetical protein B0H14DRAFT_2568040 [Mycena olivaceomarginata]